MMAIALAGMGQGGRLHAPCERTADEVPFLQVDRKHKMGNPPGLRSARWLRVLAWSLASWLVLGAFAPAFGAPVTDGESPGFLVQLWQVFANLFNMPALMEPLRKPEFTFAAFVALNLIVFVETGLLLGFFLPGDSLLVTAGVVCAHPQCEWILPLLLATLC